MKSYWINGDTMALVLRDVPVPEPRPGTVLVKMRAVALNRGEFIGGHGLHAPGTFKTAGYEGAGEVHALGAGVTNLKVGDRVTGRAEAAFAEYAIMRADEAMPVPATMDWGVAAGAGITYLTAFDGLVREGQCAAGDWALIPAASSGVGVACIQIAKVLGVSTFGITGSPAKFERLRSLGMTTGVASRAPDFAGKVLEATGGKGAKAAINSTGGSVLSECLRSLAYRGTVVIVGYVDGDLHPTFDFLTTHVNRLRVVGISAKKLPPEYRKEISDHFNRIIVPHFASGALVPVVDRSFSFDDLQAAREYLETDQHVGKVVAKL